MGITTKLCKLINHGQCIGTRDLLDRYFVKETTMGQTYSIQNGVHTHEKIVIISCYYSPWFAYQRVTHNC